MNKKSQITIFVIIGMIMVASVMLFFYFRANIAKKAEIIIPESMPIKNYVEDCMYRIAKEGILVLGLNGGYINFPKEIENNPLSYLSAGGFLSNPYWWYDGVSKIPTEGEVKQQIADEVTNKLKECLNNFKDFEDVYSVKEKGNIVTKVYLNEEDVTINVDYPLDIITVNKTKTKLVSYRTVIPIRLKKSYELAKAIMERENIESFIEQKTIDLMVLDNEEKIPLDHVEVSCGKKEWHISDVKKTLKELLRRNLQFIKIAGTNYNEQSYIPIPELYSKKQTFDESYYNYHYIWTVMETPPEDMHVAFMYDEVWPIDVYARPSRNGILRSNAQKGFGILELFCLHVWHFTYDISFPIIVTIKDDKTTKHDEFSFIFAFKSNIDHNQPARKSIATNVFKPMDRETNEEYCSDLYNEVTIHTMDNTTKLPIDDVDLEFVCGSFSCPIGVSEFVDGGAAAILKTKFPYCVQGIIKGKANGYDENQAWIQTDIDGKEYELYLTPIKLIENYTIVKHSYENGVVSANEEKLEDDEMVTITIKRDGFDSFGAYPTAEPYLLKLLDKDDFTYELEVYLIKNNTIIGGYKGNWTITENELENLKKIKFHVVTIDTKGDTGRYVFMESLEVYSKDVPRPEVIIN